MTKKWFSTGAILSVLHDTLMCEFGEVHELLEYLDGGGIPTHLLPKAADMHRSKLVLQFPKLEEITTDHINRDNYHDEYQKIINKVGPGFNVEI